MIKILKDRRGTVAFPLFLLILFACSAMVLDIGRAHMIQAKMQLIDDASALAGAMTAEIEKTVECVIDEENEEMVIREIPGEAKAKINDHEAAHRAARRAEQANGGLSTFWSKVIGKYEEHREGQNLGENETGWAGWVSSEKAYTTETKTKLAPGFLKFLGFDGMGVYTSGTAEAYIEKNGE